MNINNEMQAYACYTPENTTLTFYYDHQREIRPGTTYDLNTTTYEEVYEGPVWRFDGTNLNVTKVVFDPSFANARPVTTWSWFDSMRNLQTIIGIEYLNTSEVISMGYMFAFCDKIIGIDVSHFNTEKVTDMTNLFSYCQSLTSLDLSSFNTTKVTDMNEMFDGCIGLKSLDLSSFNTDKVKFMNYMFSNCYFLKTIFGLNWRMKCGGHNMFHHCYNLIGGQGTTYNSSNPRNKAYAHIDGGPSDPGYFTEK